MIKANELRIGNWVDGSNEFYYQINSHSFENTNFNITKPIPLTPEILEKCGFEKGVNLLNLNKDWFIAKGAFDFFLQVEKDADLTYVCERLNLNHIKHLHQLQNLYFALTGEELNVNL